MANRPDAGGFKWQRSKTGPTGSTPPRVVKHIASAYGTSLRKGQPVGITTDGSIISVSTGTAVYGIFDGMKQVYNATTGEVLPAGMYAATVTWGSVVARQSQAYVIPVRDQIFRACCDDATTATTQLGYEAFEQENADWATGTASGDQAGMLIDISTHNTTNTLALRIENVVDKEVTNFAATGVELEVSFNVIQDTLGGSATGT